MSDDIKVINEKEAYVTCHICNGLGGISTGDKEMFLVCYVCKGTGEVDWITSIKQKEGPKILDDMIKRYARKQDLPYKKYRKRFKR